MMPTYYTIVVLVLAGIFGVRTWYRRAVARQAAKDEKALLGPHPAMEDAKFGRRYSSPAMAAPHDQSKTEISQRKADARACRKRAQSAKVIQQMQARSPKVADIKARRAK